MCRSNKYIWRKQSANILAAVFLFVKCWRECLKWRVLHACVRIEFDFVMVNFYRIPESCLCVCVIEILEISGCDMGGTFGICRIRVWVALPFLLL